MLIVLVRVLVFVVAVQVVSVDGLLGRFGYGERLDHTGQPAELAHDRLAALVEVGDLGPDRGDPLVGLVDHPVTPLARVEHDRVGLLAGLTQDLLRLLARAGEVGGHLLAQAAGARLGLAEPERRLLLGVREHLGRLGALGVGIGLGGGPDLLGRRACLLELLGRRSHQPVALGGGVRGQPVELVLVGGTRLVLLGAALRELLVERLVRLGALALDLLPGRGEQVLDRLVGPRRLLRRLGEPLVGLLASRLEPLLRLGHEGVVLLLGPLLELGHLRLGRLAQRGRLRLGLGPDLVGTGGGVRLEALHDPRHLGPTGLLVPLDLGEPAGDLLLGRGQQARRRGTGPRPGSARSRRRAWLARGGPSRSPPPRPRAHRRAAGRGRGRRSA